MLFALRGSIVEFLKKEADPSAGRAAPGERDLPLVEMSGAGAPSAHTGGFVPPPSQSHQMLRSDERAQGSSGPDVSFCRARTFFMEVSFVAAIALWDQRPR
jgi:hypothetical protein